MSKFDKAKFSRFFKAILVLLFTMAVLLAGCGGGGGGDDDDSASVPAVTPPTQNVRGTYVLRGFLVKYSDGTIFTEKDLSSFSGTMKIGMDTISQSIVLNGQVAVAYSGTYSITYTNGTSEGLFHITDSLRTYDFSFATSGNLFHTYSGIVTYSGLTYEEWDYWEKTDDMIGLVSGPIEDQDAQSQFKFIGDILIENNLINNE